MNRKLLIHKKPWRVLLRCRSLCTSFIAALAGLFGMPKSLVSFCRWPATYSPFGNVDITSCTLSRVERLERDIKIIKKDMIHINWCRISDPMLRLLCAQIGLYTVQRHWAADGEEAAEAAWAKEYGMKKPQLLCFAHLLLGGGFKDFLFSSLLGEDSHFDYIIFFKWVETTN